MAQRHTPTAEVEMGVEVSTDSASEATGDSIADMKLEVAVPPACGVEDLGAGQAGQELHP